MKSKIAEYIKLKNQPIAVVKSNVLPENAVSFKEGSWNCAVGMLNAAAKGRTAALSERTVGCNGGKAGTGFKPLEPGSIEYFLSTGGNGTKEGEFYKKTPELALEYVRSMPATEADEYLLLVPLDKADETADIRSVIFLVNADQLSALATLANYDRASQNNVQLRFGAGCAQAILISLCDEDAGADVCTVGLTDPSGRSRIDRDLLSFSIPYHRFLEMEENAEGSFLTKTTWRKLAERIE